MKTFISVGNATQPFHRLLDAVSSIASRLPQPVLVQHGNTPFTDSTCRSVRFLGMEAFAECMKKATVVILHAGAGSLIHAITMGKIPVVMPRASRWGEIVDDHQIEFARSLAHEGKIILVEQPTSLLKAVHEAISKQQETEPLGGTPTLIDEISRVLDECAKTRMTEAIL
jgi:UDP-N-acetylglucosamine transferase subunit ALG13